LESDAAVGAYYAAHNEAPIWLKDDASRTAARDFIAILRDAAADGISDGAALAQQIEAAYARGRADDDRIISRARCASSRHSSPMPGSTMAIRRFGRRHRG
jgi:hypothetical protein